MRYDSTKESIEKDISVNRHMIIVAKGYLMNLNSSEEINLLDEVKNFTATQGFAEMKVFQLQDPSSAPQLTGYISWSIAFSYAVLELINANQLISTSAHLAPNNITVQYSSLVSGRGGDKGSWTFTNLAIPTPSKVIRPLYKGELSNFTLFDPDLFIEHMEIPNSHEDVREALSDTIVCFKQELYRPSLTMLGKALEGAWIELGVSLAGYAAQRGHDVEKNEALQDKLRSRENFSNKVEKVIQLYGSHHKDWYDDIRKETNIQSGQLAGLHNWSDLIRKSRNAIHFGVKLDTEINYEKTAVILLASIDNFKLIYSLKGAADNG